jgi:hypothetical protein
MVSLISSGSKTIDSKEWSYLGSTRPESESYTEDMERKSNVSEGENMNRLLNNAINLI